MTGLVASRFISEFLFGFGALFAIINPYGLAFVFLDKTINLSERERARIAFRVAICAFGVLLVSLFIGSQMLNFFGISIPALRIAGGLCGRGVRLVDAIRGRARWPGCSARKAPAS